jgi:hypothetical protein
VFQHQSAQKGIAMTGAAANALRALWAEGASVYRCNGTPEEVSDYAAGVGGDGWRIPNSRRPRVGDLLVGVAARRRLVVDLCQVDGVVPKQGGRGFWAQWHDETDVRLLPGIPLTAVTGSLRPDLPAYWTRLDGDDAQQFVESLAAAVEAPDVAYGEGGERVAVCRKRSRELREAALAKYDHICFVCGFRPREAFGDLGTRALDCHHLDPMAARKGPRKSQVNDVRILCATCHRLAHTFPVPDLEVLDTVQRWWADARDAGVLVGPMTR